MLWHYWFLLPVGILIALIAMSAGVSGAALWVPVYLLWLRLDVAAAFWLGLLTMLFGFGSGAFRNWRDGTYRGRLVMRYSLVSVPAAIVGGWAVPWINEHALVAMFGTFLVVYSAIVWLKAWRDGGLEVDASSTAWGLAMIEGLCTGLISTGSGILTLPHLLRDASIAIPAEAVGSGVMIIFATSTAATLARMRPSFVAALWRQLPQLSAIMVWAAPAVVIGGQLGPRLARAMPSRRHAQLYLSAILMLIGVLTLLRSYGAAALAAALRH